MSIHKLIAFGSALLLMAATAGFLGWFKAHQRLGEPGLSLELPARALDYDSEQLEVTEEEIGALPADTSFGRRLYQQVREGRTNQILVSIVLMGSDRTSIHKPQFCLVGQGWKIERTEKVNLAVEQPHKYLLPVMKLTASKQFETGQGQPVQARGLYVYWFVADQSLTADHWQRMWWMAKRLLLTGVLQRWAYVSCFSTCQPGQEEAAFERMREFIAAVVPEFQLAAGPVLVDHMPETEPRGRE